MSKQIKITILVPPADSQRDSIVKINGRLDGICDNVLYAENRAKFLTSFYGKDRTTIQRLPRKFDASDF